MLVKIRKTSQNKLVESMHSLSGLLAFSSSVLIVEKI